MCRRLDVGDAEGVDSVGAKICVSPTAGVCAGLGGKVFGSAFGRALQPALRRVDVLARSGGWRSAIVKLPTNCSSLLSIGRL